ncbi:GAF domain-containing protein [Actomonas aquatica]|uniref:histidine kinase n=1 Tax=Actomonas aquatica TaxID=2866162 RepID=A0ABZ1C7R5_9BACT|nr:GAF domain-containing protein [Opitutus sp. WL0086]WRQ87483.1 GAF domain-containing protein [Opitutus sp. WL0086]
MELPPDSRTLPALYRISSLAGRKDEPRAILLAILKAVIEAVGATSGDISLLNPDTGKLEIEIADETNSAGYDDLSLRLGQGITGWVAFHGRPQLVHDVGLDPRYVRVRDNVRTEMVTPMIGSNGQVMGVINVDGEEPGCFNDTDLELMLILTEEATSVMERHWELQNLRGKERQLQSLISIGQTLVTKLEPEDLFNSLTQDARSITAARACALYLHEPETSGGAARLVAYDGPTPTTLPEGALPLDSCLVASAIHTRRAVEFSNVQSREFVDVIDLPREASLRSILATPLQIEDEIIGVLAIFTDTTHRFNNDEKRLVRALASLGAVALQNSRLYARVFQSEATLRKNEQLTTLGLLAAEIAHEIRNPLTVLKLLFSTLRLEYPDDDPRKTDVRVITEKLDQLEAIVSRVLNFAKAPSSLHSRWNVTDIIEDTLVLIRLKLTQGKIHLRFEPPDIPLVIDVNKGQLQQVLLNLLLNATQVMPNGGTITVSTSVETRAEGGRQVCISVTDTGPGIHPSMRDRIFDSFLSGRPDGTGLGLSIAKRILVSHHGDLELRSTGPEGTTMALLLPLA